jgi:outer membrane protein assembly factor BamB
MYKYEQDNFQWGHKMAEAIRSEASYMFDMAASNFKNIFISRGTKLGGVSEAGGHTTCLRMAPGDQTWGYHLGGLILEARHTKERGIGKLSGCMQKHSRRQRQKAS